MSTFYTNEAHAVRVIEWITADEAILDDTNATDEAKNAATFRIDKNYSWLVMAVEYGNKAADNFLTLTLQGEN